VSLWENLVGAVGLEPTNPSLVRRDRTVAGHRGLSLEEPDGWVVRRMTSPDVARRLPPLAPRLAPWDMISLANDRHVQIRKVRTSPPGRPHRAVPVPSCTAKGRHCHERIAQLMRQAGLAHRWPLGPASLALHRGITRGGPA